MEKRMISCKHCGEHIRPDDERCPYCNAKLEVDYASLYPAYPGMKYYLQGANTFNGRLPFSIIVIISSIILISGGVFFTVAFDTVMKYMFVIPAWALGVFLVAIEVYTWFFYMTWDGGDVLTVRKGNKIARYNISSIKFISTEFSYINQKLSSGRRGTSQFWAVVSNDDVVLFLIVKGKAIKNFFMHFGIPIYSHIDGGE